MFTLDVGCALERTEHEGDAAILAHMGQRLDARAAQVEIGDLIGSQDAETVIALGRHVHMASVARRGGRHEKHLLRLDEGADTIVDMGVSLCHGGSVGRRGTVR